MRESKFDPAFGVTSGVDTPLSEIPDTELPGMWQRADFVGGKDEVRGPAAIAGVVDLSAVEAARMGNEALANAAPARSFLCEHDCSEDAFGGPRCTGPCVLLDLYQMEAAAGVDGQGKEGAGAR